MFWNDVTIPISLYTLYRRGSWKDFEKKKKSIRYWQNTQFAEDVPSHIAEVLTKYLEFSSQ